MRPRQEERTPSLEEQDAAARYVLLRPLPRPKTDWKRAIRWVFLWLLLNSAIFVGLLLLTGNARISWAALLLSGILSLRFAAVGAIRLYQRYASERTRRRCLFQPTCSEYAILAVRKYGAVVGLAMSAHRVLRRCRGSVFRIDYP